MSLLLHQPLERVVPDALARSVADPAGLVGPPDHAVEGAGVGPGGDRRQGHRYSGEAVGRAAGVLGDDRLPERSGQIRVQGFHRAVHRDDTAQLAVVADPGEVLRGGPGRDGQRTVPDGAGPRRLETDLVEGEFGVREVDRRPGDGRIVATTPSLRAALAPGSVPRHVAIHRVGLPVQPKLAGAVHELSLPPGWCDA